MMRQFGGMWIDSFSSETKFIPSFFSLAIKMNKFSGSLFQVGGEKMFKKNARKVRLLGTLGKL